MLLRRGGIKTAMAGDAKPKRARHLPKLLLTHPYSVPDVGLDKVGYAVIS